MMDNKTDKKIPIPFLRWRGFTIRIFLITILPLLLIILGIVFLSQFLHLREMRSMVGDRNLRTVRLASELIQQQLQQKNDLLLMVKSEMQLNQQSIPDTHLFDGGLAIFDSSQNRVIKQNTLFLIDHIPEDLVQQWSGLNDGEVSPPHSIAYRDIPLTIIATPLSGDTFLVAAFNHQTLLRSSLAGLGASQSVTVLVIDRDNHIVFQIGTFSENETPASHSGVNEGLAGESGVNYLDYGANEHVIAFAPVAISNWAIIIEETWASIATPLVNTTFYTPLILIPILIIAVIALWFGANQIIRPLQTLQQKAQLMGKGNFAEIRDPVGGIEEIRQLQQQLINVSEELQFAQANLHHYIGAITDGIENERLNLARELHDDTIQSLIALQQRIQMAGMQVDNDQNHSLNQIKDLRSMLQKSITNLRRLVRGLRPAYLDDLGLVSALQMLVDENGQTLSHPIQFETTGEEKRLDGDVELAFFRIAQEALANVSRHSQATQVSVKLSYLENKLILEIHDNGIGFVFPDRPETFAASSHFGLIGMKERSDLVNASLSIRTKPQGGTSILLKYPVVENTRN